jgi:predicted transcriptional regulator
MPKLMKRHFDITKSVEVEKEKIEEVKDLFNKIIDDFEQ